MPNDKGRQDPVKAPPRASEALAPRHPPKKEDGAKKQRRAMESRTHDLMAGLSRRRGRGYSRRGRGCWPKSSGRRV